jgi:uncharacterized cupin superfamily protein
MALILNARGGDTLRVAHGSLFEARVTPLAEKLGARLIGSNVTAIAPGKAAYPLHHHFANEEHFYVLGGTGILRYGTATHAVGPGDYIFTPPGGPDVAHQFINTGAEELTVLAISTKLVPEVVGYPDSGKTGVRASADQEHGRFLVENRNRNSIGYWDGEDGTAVAAVVSGARAGEAKR